MCTVFVLKGCSALAPLVIASNRDERLSRDWLAPRQLPELPEIMVPLDAHAGGTWLGVNRRGMFATLTNRLFASLDLSLPTRGTLVLRALAHGDVDAARHAIEQALRRQRHNGFNLLLADAATATVLTYGDSHNNEIAIRQLDDGVHLLTSAHDLDPPVLQSLRQRCAEIAATAASEEALLAALRQLLADHADFGEGYSVCKHAATYGTRSATVALLHPGRSPRLWFAHGRPCEFDFEACPWKAA